MSHGQKVGGSARAAKTAAHTISQWHALIGQRVLIYGSGCGILLADRPRGGRSGAHSVGDDDGTDDARD